MPHRRYSRDHDDCLPGRKPKAAVTAGPDAPDGTPAPARVRRDGSHHDVLASRLDPSRQTGHAGQAFGLVTPCATGGTSMIAGALHNFRTVRRPDCLVLSVRNL